MTQAPHLHSAAQAPSPAAGAAIDEAAARPASSSLVVDVATIAERMRGLVAAARTSGIRLLHTVKSSTTPEVLRAADGAGLGFDVSNAREIRSVEDAGVVAPWLSCTPTSLPEDAMRALVPLAHERRLRRMHLDSVRQLDQWLTVAGSGPVGLRLNVAPEAWPDGVPARRVSRFGVRESELGAASTVATRHGSSVEWLHLHNASEENTVASFTAGLDLILERARACAPELRSVNLGGGLPRESAGELAAMFATLRRQAPDVELVLEPGRWWSRGCVHLVTEVLDLKVTDRCVFVVVASGSEARRWSAPVLPPLGPHPDAPALPYVVCGATAYEQDFLGQVDPDPHARPPRVGDRLVMGGLSTYSIELLTHFNAVTTETRIVS